MLALPVGGFTAKLHVWVCGVPPRSFTVTETVCVGSSLPMMLLIGACTVPTEPPEESAVASATTAPSKVTTPEAGSMSS